MEGKIRALYENDGNDNMVLRNMLLTVFASDLRSAIQNNPADLKIILFHFREFLRSMQEEYHLPPMSLPDLVKSRLRKLNLGPYALVSLYVPVQRDDPAELGTWKIIGEYSGFGSKDLILSSEF